MFDIYVLPINLISGQEQPDLPGLLTASPFRRANRHRAGDLLAIFLTLTGSSPLTIEESDDLLQSLSTTYYSASGSVTAAMRTVAGELHQFLLARNLRRQKDGGPALGLLNMAVIREEILYLLHAGPTYTYVLGNGDVQSFHEDSQYAGRGLGLSRSVNLRFFQAELQPGHLVLFCPEPPASWSPTILSGTQFSLEGVRRRLYNQVGTDLRAAIIQFRTGNGQIHRLKPRAPLAAPQPVTTEIPAIPSEAVVENAPTTLPLASSQDQPDQETAEPQAADGFTGADAVEEPSIQTNMPASVEAPVTPTPLGDLEVSVDISSSAQPVPPLQAGTTVAPAAPRKTVLPPLSPPERPSQSYPAQNAARRPVSQTGQPPRSQRLRGIKQKPAAPPLTARVQAIPWRKHLAAAFLTLRSASKKTSRASRAFLTRLLPESGTESHRTPAALLFFIAIAIPLIVVAIATTVYLRSGRDTQQKEFLRMAQQYTEKALSPANDPVVQRANWITVIKWVEKAEQIGTTDQTFALRRKAQDALDVMDGVNRLYLQPVLPEGFTAASQFTRIAATNTDIYLLDSARGRVLRLFVTGQGYTLDQQFICSPTSSRGKTLVDIVTLPPNNQNRATVLVIDDAGNQTYCAPGKDLLTNQLPPTERGWGKIAGVTLRQDVLFVLDPPQNDVLRYSDKNYDFGDQPRSFFSTQVLNLNDVIDMAISDDDLYLLHQNGKMILCTASIINVSLQGKCTDPAPYGDMRANREHQPLYFPDALFTQMQIVAPPDPSLFMMDVHQSAIYHFSLRYLNLQRILQPAPAGNFLLPKSGITAFTITPGRLALVAYGNQVFYAPLP